MKAKKRKATKKVADTRAVVRRVMSAPWYAFIRGRPHSFPGASWMEVESDELIKSTRGKLSRAVSGCGYALVAWDHYYDSDPGLCLFDGDVYQPHRRRECDISHLDLWPHLEFCRGLVCRFEYAAWLEWGSVEIPDWVLPLLRGRDAHQPSETALFTRSC